MEVGTLLVMQNWYEDRTDEDVFTKEIALGKVAEEVGFDGVWCAEHHFDDYSMSPDNFQILAYVAAQTSKVKLGLGAAILPWNDPLRVVEKAIALDHLSGGRVVMGIGRGLAKMEYEAFGIPMDEARGRFNESANVVLDGLRTGVVEGSGPFYNQPKIDVRPAPNLDRPWDDRVVMAAMSPDSIPIAAELGVRMMTFMQFDTQTHAEAINKYRELYKEAHGAYPPAPLVQDFVVCHEDEEEAKRLAEEYLSKYFLSVIKHYDFAGSHWRETKGYETYQVGADMIREAGMEAAGQGYANANVWGTPEQIVEKYRERREVFGCDFNANAAFCFGGIPFEHSENGMRLFGEKVIPELHKF